MPVVQVGNQRFSFPDSMSREEIQAVLDERFNSAKQQKTDESMTAAPIAASAEQYGRDVSRAFTTPIAKEKEPEDESYLGRLMRKVKETESQISEAATPGPLDVAGQAITEVARPVIETGLGLVAAPTAGMVAQVPGTAVGVAEALRQGLKPGTPEFNQTVSDFATSAARGASELLMPAPADTIGQRIVRGTQEALAPLPPYMGAQRMAAPQFMPRILREPSALEISDVPTFGPPVMGPPTPPTALQAAKALSARDYAALQTMGSADEQTLAAQRALGVEMPTEVSVTGPVQEVMRSFAAPDTEAGKRVAKSTEQVMGKLQEVTEKYGATRDLSEVEATVRKDMFANVKRLEDLANTKYENLNSMIDKSTEVPADNLVAFVKEQIQAEGGISKISPELRTLYRDLKPRVKIVNGERIVVNPTYGHLDRIRRELTAAKYENKGAFKDANSGLTKKLESLLQADQDEAINAIGGKELFDAYQDAKGTVSTRKQLEDNIANLFGEQVKSDKIVGQFMGDLRGGVQKLSTGDYDRVQRIIENIPESMRKKALSSTIVDNIAANPENFLQWYEGVMRNSKSRSLIMKNTDPELRTAISNAYTLSKKIDNFYKLVPSERLRKVSLKGDSLIMSFLSRAAPNFAELIVSLGRRQRGVSSAAVSSFIEDPSGKIYKAQDFLASDDFKRLMLGLETPQENKAIKRAASSRRFNDYADAIQLPKDRNQRQLWLLNAMQAGAIQQQQEQQQEMRRMAQ